MWTVPIALIIGIGIGLSVAWHANYAGYVDGLRDGYGTCRNPITAEFARGRRRLSASYCIRWPELGNQVIALRAARAFSDVADTAPKS